MHRNIDEVLQSQRKMLIHRGETVEEMGDAGMAELFAKHLVTVKQWLRGQPNFAVLDIDYNAMLQNPEPFVHTINQFIDNSLDEQAMATVVNPTLYRNRA